MPFRVDSHEVAQLADGWEAAPAAPGEAPDPAAWRSARVPGTAAAAAPDEPRDFDAEDWCFRTRFDAAAAEAGEEAILRLGGIATLAEVRLNGERLLESESMFVPHALDVGALLRGSNELEIRCRALAPLLAEQRKPRARWRTKLVDGNLRWFRTMLIGRAPGFAPGPAAVGPWRPVELERRRGIAVDELGLRSRLDGDDGVVAVRALVRALDGSTPAAVEVELGGRSTTLPLEGGVAAGELRVPAAERWWPHTHGDPVLHAVRLRIGGVSVDAGRIGFRELGFGDDFERDGLDLRVNGVRVFARGAVWTPVDPVGLAPPEEELRAAVEQARDAGMNMLRVPGLGAYESDPFYDLCDELGVLLWQDFMFANLDYPVEDEGFRALVEHEARTVLERLAGRPSPVVLCGNSEVEQQVAMLGLDPALGRGELFGELLPRLVREADVDAAYVPSAPSGGDLPFWPSHGVANYFGVGGYRRPLTDARLANVRFASECLAFANVPDAEVADGEGVPRDVGADWDFADVRDHYLAALFGVDPDALRRDDRARYLELSRAVTGEVMAAVFGEWRRAASPCAGGLVLWLRDVVPGAGWGVVDSGGAPKVALHHLRRALAPVAVWLTDEGLGGVGVHVANDRPEPLAARLRVALYRDWELKVEEADEGIEVPPHDACERNVESLLGRFVDASWAYRFGPPGHDVIVASLEQGDRLLSQAFHFPAARPLAPEPPDRLGLAVDATTLADGFAELRLWSRRFAYGVRVDSAGFVPMDDAFSIEPAGERRVLLRPRTPGTAYGGAVVTALNLRGSVADGGTP